MFFPITFSLGQAEQEIEGIYMRKELDKLRREFLELKAEVAQLKKDTQLRRWEYIPMVGGKTYTMSHSAAIEQLIKHAGLELQFERSRESHAFLAAPKKRTFCQKLSKWLGGGTYD